MTFGGLKHKKVLMKNAIVFLIILFAAPVWSLADIQKDKDGHYVEFAYATMSDGVKIAIAVGYPKGFDPQDPTQKWPAILEMSGYPSATQPVYRGERYGERYVTVSASVRGTGASFGSYYDYSETIIRDGYEVIENWIAKQPWSNGKVGVNGHSWSGYIGFMIASSNPPHLDAVVVSGISDDNIRGTYRPGGIDNIGFNARWLKRASLPTGVFGSDQAAAQIRGLSETEIREIQKSRPPKVPAHELLQKVTKEGSSRALRHFAKDIRVPILILHAYQDRQTGGMWLWEQIPDDTPKRLLISNGDHNTLPTLTAQRRWTWFNFWLPVGEGTFSMGAVGKTYDNSKGIRAIEGNKDLRFPMTAVELLNTDIDFLDFHVYRWGAKGTGADVFNHFAENMKLFTPEAKELMKSKPIIMGEFGSFNFDETTLNEAIIFVNELNDAALDFGFKGSCYWTMRCFEQTRLWNLMWENGKMLKAFSESK